jgi:hypothetical protein
MNERSNNAMNLVRLAWDFLLGVIIIGATPLIAFTLVGFVGVTIFHVDLAMMDTIVQKIACVRYLSPQ